MFVCIFSAHQFNSIRKMFMIHSCFCPYLRYLLLNFMVVSLFLCHLILECAVMLFTLTLSSFMSIIIELSRANYLI
uniref:Uncharacterized protein n=1 Tax=Cannabis sativa TaxID=3483 RepID=A0A803QUK1_CANSA